MLLLLMLRRLCFSVVCWVLKISLPSSWRHQQCGHVVRSSSCVDRARGGPSNDEDPYGHGSS